MKPPDPYTRLPIRVKRKHKRTAVDLLRAVALLVFIAVFFSTCWAIDKVVKN